MPEITANSLTLHYDDHGQKDDPAILLVMGLGAQMVFWPMELVEALVERGFRVIRYDNRDIGLSHKFDGVKAPGVLKMLIFSKLGIPIRAPYSLSDMAADGAGVLDALEIDRAHIVGASMGGMIAQHFGFGYAHKVHSITSIMSTTGHPKLPAAEPAAFKALTKRPKSNAEDDLVEHGMAVVRAIGSPGYRVPEDRLRERVRGYVRRSVYQEGFMRQLAAIVSDGSRRERLASITAPTLVIHGEDDPLVPLSGGEDTAAHIPGAKIRTFPGMGHDLPLELVEPMADAIADHARIAA